MSPFFGPVDLEGRIPARQQTRATAFLMSAHGALARQFAVTLPLRMHASWQTEMNAQFYRESEIVSLLARATSWVPDPALMYLIMSWETAWFPTPVEGIADRSLAASLHLATLAHAINAAIRPAALLPAEARLDDPFVVALRRIEFESGRMLQAQMIYLKSSELIPFRQTISMALERRHAEVRRLWREALEGVGICDYE